MTATRAPLLITMVFGLLSSVRAQDLPYELIELELAEAAQSDIVNALMRPGGQAEQPAIALHMQFEFDSYALAERTKLALSNLGAALSSEALSDFRFGIASQSAAATYQRELAARRSAGIIEYLTQVAGLTEERIEALTLSNDANFAGNARGHFNDYVVLILNLSAEDG